MSLRNRRRLRRGVGRWVVASGLLVAVSDGAVVLVEDADGNSAEVVPQGKWMTEERRPRSAVDDFSSIFDEGDAFDYNGLMKNVHGETTEDDLYMAKDRYKHGDVPGALNIIQKLRATKPDNGILAILEATMLLDMERLPEALKSASLAARKMPENIISWSLLGTCQARLNEPDKAIRAFRRVLAFEPDFIPANRALGDIHFSQGDFQEGVNRYTVLAEQDCPVMQVFSTSWGRPSGRWASWPGPKRRCVNHSSCYPLSRVR